jgi:chromosome segregation protein
MHLRSLVLKGFKSFPDRTRLDFSPGVSVIVGPNGSGKSNVAEAVLWALGEQSPSAVRGQTMQDVIFAGGQGLASRSAAEVEVILDDSDAGGPDRPGAPSGFSEISIARRLERSGEGGYRLNGARCRLVDVAEVLSDTGLGREMHSVVSQGRVEAIVHSRPLERRRLIEEAAGLGKHRRRRRRAELKLGHTRENLERALDVEREARSGLRPLKRQAEAADLHARLERGMLEARLELGREDLRVAEEERAGAEEDAAQARAERDEADRRLSETGRRREQVELDFAEHARAREALAGRVHAARSAEERIGLRLEHAREAARAAGDGARRRRTEVERLDADAERAGEATSADDDGDRRVAALEAELAELDEVTAERRRGELADLEQQHGAAERAREQAAAEEQRTREDTRELDRAAQAARVELREAERAVEAARARAAAAGAEVASTNAFLRAAGGAGDVEGPTLVEGLEVERGYELALAAVLGPRLRAAVVDDLTSGEAALARAGGEGGTVLVAGDSPGAASDPARASKPPTRGAVRLLERLRPAPDRAALAARLIADVWVVDALADVDADFPGVAVTREGRVLDAGLGELRQAAAGGEERLLAERNRREELVAASEAAAQAEAAARAALERASERVAQADREREAGQVALHAVGGQADEAAENARRVGERLGRAREAADEGPEAERRAALEAELRAERRLAERERAEREERAERRSRLAARVERDEAVRRGAERAIEALADAHTAVSARRVALGEDLEAGAALGERTAAELRACAREEADVQARLRAATEALTAAEVSAERSRDRTRERADELADIARGLGSEQPPSAAPDALSPDRRAELEARNERLRRRREQLGPVNPLAAEAYAEALGHVEELEGQREDLETALAELESLIRDIDRRIRESFEETFAAAARNFEEVVAHLFPGGRGRLRLVRPDCPGPALVDGDGGLDAGSEGARDGEGEDGLGSGDLGEGTAGERDGGEGSAPPRDDEPGVEVEVTPAGKATRRLSLLSGGEKSLIAIAFVFAVFLARPCPFYILDEVEAALDDLNIDRFLELLRRYSDRAQFIVVTHQKRTMDAADRVYGVSMGADGVSKVVSRRLREPGGALVVDGERDAEAA